MDGCWENGIESGGWYEVVGRVTRVSGGWYEEVGWEERVSGG